MVNLFILTGLLLLGTLIFCLTILAVSCLILLLSDKVMRPLAIRSLKRDQKAREFLRCWLTSEQMNSLLEEGSFAVEGSDTGNLYTIQYGRLSVRRNLDGVCFGFYPRDRLCDADIALAQKLMLETNEPWVMSRACRG